MEHGLGSVSLVEASVPSCWELLLGGYVQFGIYVFTALLPAQQYFLLTKVETLVAWHLFLLWNTN